MNERKMRLKIKNIKRSLLKEFKTHHNQFHFSLFMLFLVDIKWFSLSSFSHLKEF